MLAGNQERLGCKKIKKRTEASVKHQEANMKRQEASMKRQEASMKHREDSVKCREASMKHTEASMKYFITDFLSDFDSFLRKMIGFCLFFLFF